MVSNDYGRQIRLRIEATRNFAALQKMNSLHLAGFTEPLKWYMRNLRNKTLHGHKACHDIKSNGVGWLPWDICEKKATLEESLSPQWRVCKTCLHDLHAGLDTEQRELWEQVRYLNFVAENIAAMETPMHKTASLPELTCWRNATIFRRAKKDLDAIEFREELQPWRTEIKHDLQQRLPKRVNLTKLTVETVHWAATQTMAKELRIVRVRSRAMDTLCRHWLTGLETGQSAAAVTTTLLRNQSLLPTITKHTVADESADNNKATTRLPARKRARSSMEVALQAWTARFEAISAPTRMTLIGIVGSIPVEGNYAPTDIASVVISTLKTISGTKSESQNMVTHGLLLCRGPVAIYLEDPQARWLNNRITVLDEMPVTKEPDMEQMQLTLNLWEPNSRGSVYKSLQAAYDAVERL